MNSQPANLPRYAKLPAWCVILIALLLSCQIASCVAGARPSLDGKVDFRAFYAAGSILRTGQQASLYDYDFQKQQQDRLISPRPAALPFLYPPFAALIFVPFSVLSYKGAFVAQLLLNLGLLFAIATLLRSKLPILQTRSTLLLAALLACFFSVSIALMQGQLSLLLLLICTLAWRSLSANREFTAGLILCLLLVKFQLALPILLLFLLWKNWRVVSGFLSGATLLGCISWLLVGTKGLQSYSKSVFAVSSLVAGNATAARARYGMFPTDMPNLHGLTFALSHGAAWGTILNVVLSGAVLFVAWRLGPSLLVALPAAMLVSYHMQPHDLCLLLLPLSVALEAYLEANRSALPLSKVPSRSLFYLLFPTCILLLPIAPVLMLCGAGYLACFAVLAVLLHPVQQLSLSEQTTFQPQALAS